MESTQEGAVKLHDSEVILYSGLLAVIPEEILILRHLLGDVLIFKKRLRIYSTFPTAGVMQNPSILAKVKKFILLPKLSALINYSALLSKLLVLLDLIPSWFSLQDTTLCVVPLYSPVYSSVSACFALFLMTLTLLEDIAQMFEMLFYFWLVWVFPMSKQGLGIWRWVRYYGCQDLSSLYQFGKHTLLTRSIDLGHLVKVTTICGDSHWTVTFL